MNWTKTQLKSTRKYYMETKDIPEYKRKAKVKEFDNLLKQCG